MVLSPKKYVLLRAGHELEVLEVDGAEECRLLRGALGN